ncbi:MAG: hypothetical protein UD455_00360, partial [Collinsella bouchesdurhonensis]|nr:hypothetical protein [Collinsella bouchesdurhonensis]
MKTATIKKSALALMACILALALALVGCGGSKADPEEAFLGSWKLSGGEIYGEELDDETIKTMEEWGLNCILILDEDGEGQLDLFGDVEDITWKVKSDGTAKISAEGVDFKATLKDDTLTLKNGDDNISFTKSKKDLSDTVKKDCDMAKANEEAEEEEAEGKGTRKAITPAVTVTDDDLCTITVTEKFEDEWGTIGLTVEITNKSDKDLTFYSPSGKTNVDGTMKEPWFSCDLMPGTNAT